MPTPQAHSVLETSRASRLILHWKRLCSDREAGARLHRVRLPDHERKLAPGAANRIQVRTDRGERKPALCGHRSQPRALARTAVVRGVVLPTRRHGEPHQRTVRLVCRAGERRDDLRQSATPLFLRYGLCVARRSAPPRAKRHRDGARTSDDDSPTTAQDRRADPHHGAQDVGGNGLQLSLPASVPARLSTTARLNLPAAAIFDNYKKFRGRCERSFASTPPVVPRFPLPLPITLLPGFLPLTCERSGLNSLLKNT